MPNRNPRQQFGFRLVTLARAWRRELDQLLAGIGLTDATWTPLIHLEESGDGISQKELAWRVGIDGSSLVRLLDILAGRGFVERRPDPDDRRANRIHLTPAGRAALKDIRRVLHREEAKLLADISDGDLTHLLDLFDRVEARLQNQRRPPR